LRIDRELLAGLFRQNADKQILFDGMPDDARIVGVSEHLSFDQDLIALKVESATFPEVMPDFAVPALEVSVTEVRPEPVIVEVEVPAKPWWEKFLRWFYGV